MTPATPLFTASQFARALGGHRQAIQRELADVSPAGHVMVAGNLASAWPVSALSGRRQAQLTEMARRRGCRTVPDLLNAAPEPLHPEFAARLRACPMAQIRAEFITRALKLRDALAAPLARQHELTGPQLTELGLQEFARHFGYPISAKHWNRLFDRTTLRDNGAEQFHRAELYLDDAAFQKPIARIAVVARQYDHGALKSLLADLLSKSALTSDDRAAIFTAAFFHTESLWANCTRAERPAAKASVIAFLFSTFPPPVLSKTVPALRRTFELRFNAWLAADRAPQSQQDARCLTSGYFRTPDFSADIQKIRDKGHALHKNPTQAYRSLRLKGELSEELVNYYSFNIRTNKSRMPDKLREEVTPQIAAAIDQYKGEREARLRGPAIPRDWSGVFPGDYYSGDDTTLNHPFSIPLGGGRHEIMRGEFLLLNDLRSGFPLDHQLIAGHYNGRHILSGLLRIHDHPKLGLARKGGYWEKGVWESRWMPGVPKQHSRHWRDTELPLRAAEFEMGELSEFERRHAISPRSKPIERAFHSIQSMMTDKAPYLGRNERLDNFKPLQDFIGRCRRGTEDPRSEGILPMEEWFPKIAEVLEEYANEPQNGKMLPGVSPREMWEDGLAKRPLRKLPTELRLALATNRRIIKRIPNTGIVLRDVPQFVYCNEELRHWQMKGREIVVFYNVDVPDLLTVSNLEATEFFTIKGIGLPAMTATNEQLREANAQIRGFMKPARVLHAQITQRKQFTVTRDANPDSPHTALGEFHNAEVAAHTAAKGERTRKLRQIQKQAALGAGAIPNHVRNPDRVLEGTDRVQSSLARIAQKKEQAS